MNSAEHESVRVTSVITASPERVFRAWIDPDLLRQWLSPLAEVDARVGGRYRLEVSKPEGSHVVSGEYLEFSPCQRLVMTWAYEGPMIPVGKMEALLTVDLLPDGPNTEISLHHQHLTNPAYFDTIRNGAWTKALEGMQSLLSGPIS